MKIIRIILVVPAIWIIGIFIELPSWPIRGDISKITIKYSDRDSTKVFTLDRQEEIKNLKEACGTIWFIPFVLNSHEGNPSWTIEISRPNGSTDKIYVDENEFGYNAEPNERILEYLKKITANQHTDFTVKTSAD